MAEPNDIELNLYRAEQVREMDRQAIEDHGIAGAVLMARAGQAAFIALRRHWPGADNILVLAGTGNNAGDGFVIARLAHSAGLTVRVMFLADPQGLKGDALTAAQDMQEAGIHGQWYDDEGLAWADLVVDAMLGTGLSGEAREPYSEAIEALNGTRCPVLAVDIPSGLSADTGQPLGVAVRARMTVSFIGLKQGLYLALGPEYRGDLVFDDLGVPDEVLTAAPSLRTLALPNQLQTLPARRLSAHKGNFGHLLVVGGAPGFGGAARMAAEAALRCGSGLVSVATHPSHAAALTAQRPEIMCHPSADRSDLDALLERATLVVLGPGLGRGSWSQALWDRVMHSDHPLLLDADALNLLADHPEHRDNWILTPHPGEAARLLGEDITWIEQDRMRAIAALTERYGGTVVLKGAGTLVQTGNELPGLCPLGNPGMASGGMGDVLSGIIGSLAGQGLQPGQAAALGVCLHATAADQAAEKDGQRGLLATDLMPELRRLVG